MAIIQCEGCERYIDLDLVDEVYVKMNGVDVPVCEGCMDRIRRCTAHVALLILTTVQTARKTRRIATLLKDRLND